MNHFQINYGLKPELGLLSISCRQDREMTAREISFRIQYHSGGQKKNCILRNLKEAAFGIENISDLVRLYQPQRTTDLSWNLPENELRGNLYLFQDVDLRFLFCKLRIVNDSQASVSIQRILLFDTGNENHAEQSRIQFCNKDHSEDMAFFSNGWQSWSFSGAYAAIDRQRRSILKFIPNAVSSNPSTPSPHRRGVFSADFFGILGNRRCKKGLLCGFVSQKEQFGSLFADLRRFNHLTAWANGDDVSILPGEALETDWMVLSWLNLDEPDVLQPYFNLVAKWNGIQFHPKIPAGWCSWYQYYTDIDAQRINRNIVQLSDLRDELPLQIFQIDDGFQTAGGDWFRFQPGFPDGIAPIAVEIKRNRMVPGLWLAPFIVNRGASLLKEHPEYILRSKTGKSINAGFISNKFSTALDLSYTPTLDYVHKIVNVAVNEWGFEYLKLDFLYAGALHGNRYDFARTRAQILRRGLETIQQSAGKDVYLMGCGVPLGSALGLFDAVRIGADTGGRWKPKLFNIPLLLRNDPQLPSLRNALQNTLTRAGMHKTWWDNDPDCLLVRPNTDLTIEELRAHATLIGLTGGSLMLSDDLSALPPDRLLIAAFLLPLIGKRPDVLDWFDHPTPAFLRLDLVGAIGHWNLVAFFNWKDYPTKAVLTRKMFRLGDEPLWVRSVWKDQNRLVKAQNVFWEQDVATHGVVLLAVRKWDGKPQYLGSNFHISQGLEVKDWEDQNGIIAARINLERIADGFLDIYLPFTPGAVHFDNTRIQVETAGQEIYRIWLHIAHKAQLSIERS